MIPGAEPSTLPGHLPSSGLLHVKKEIVWPAPLPFGASATAASSVPQLRGGGLQGELEWVRAPGNRILPWGTEVPAGAPGVGTRPATWRAEAQARRKGGPAPAPTTQAGRAQGEAAVGPRRARGLVPGLSLQCSGSRSRPCSSSTGTTRSRSGTSLGVGMGGGGRTRCVVLPRTRAARVL